MLAWLIAANLLRWCKQIIFGTSPQIIWPYMKSIRYAHLPPLNTLLPFEAAARHESFARAADELFITSSAVAHQVKTLEAALGIELFIRHPRGVSLSLQGQSYLSSIQQHLSELNLHSAEVRDFTLRPLRITTLHAIAQLWLQPRLGEYQDQHSNQELEITAHSTITEQPKDTDIAIAYFNQPPASQHWQLLWHETLQPVCHPDYLQQENPVLYRDSHWANDWDVWSQRLIELGELVPSVQFSRIRSASLYVLVLQSVLDKRGVMVGRYSLLKDYLDQGKLVCWPETQAPAVNCGAYYFYQSPASINNPFVKEFREWLYDQL